MSKEYVKKNFGKAQHDACKSIHDNLIRTWGISGWWNLGETFRDALICEKVLYVFAGRDYDSKISSMEISKYIEAMRRYCDILKDDE